MATCDTVTVEGTETDPISNESRLEVPVLKTSAPEPSVIVAEIQIRNTLLSGDGEQLSGTVSVQLDGSEVDSFSVSPPAGSTTTETVRIEGVSGGDHEVCVEVA